MLSLLNVYLNNTNPPYGDICGHKYYNLSRYALLYCAEVCVFKKRKGYRLIKLRKVRTSKTSSLFSGELLCSLNTQLPSETAS